jgi:hypothetical protein
MISIDAAVFMITIFNDVYIMIIKIYGDVLYISVLILQFIKPVFHDRKINCVQSASFCLIGRYP